MAWRACGVACVRRGAATCEKAHDMPFELTGKGYRSRHELGGKSTMRLRPLSWHSVPSVTSTCSGSVWPGGPHHILTMPPYRR